MHQSFVCHVRLGSPVLLGRRLTLDGLLSAVLFSRLQDLDRALEAIPLTSTQGILHGSAAFVEGPAQVGAFTIGSSLQVNRLDPAQIKPKKNGTYPTVSLANGEFRNHQSHYVSHATRALWFGGHGDVETVRDLLGSVDGVGAKRSSGWGRVTRIEIEALDDGDAGDHPGLKLTDGTPARPVPQDIWTGIEGGEADYAFERPIAPYTSGDAVLCAVPRTRIAAKSDLQRLFGVTL